MIRQKRESLEWLEFEIFQEFPEISHAIFFKHSEKPPLQNIISAHQMHGTTVIEAKLNAAQEMCDGLLTDKKEVGLVMRHADCQATIFYDPVKKVIGNVHAGWRGQAQGIYKGVVQKMQTLYGCAPENLIVGVSPSLGPCCAQFIHYETELPPDFWDHQVRPLYFDLWAIAKLQLKEAGVLEDHLQVARICTCCARDDFFSYRRDKVRGQNQSTVVRMRRI